MNNAISVNLQTQHIVDAGTSVSTSNAHLSKSCHGGECSKQDDGGFFDVLNAEISALDDNEPLDTLPLIQVEYLENIEEINDFDLPNVALLNLQQQDNKNDESLKFGTTALAGVDNKTIQKLEEAFQHAFNELPKNITSLPLTPENKQFIQQQALAIVELKHPDLMLKLQAQDGQVLPLEGILLPLVDDLLSVKEITSLETSKPASLATTSLQSLPLKEISTVISGKESAPEVSISVKSEQDSELNFKHMFDQKSSDSEQSDEKQNLNELMARNSVSKEVPVQKFSTEAVSTSINNVLGANQASITTPNAAAVQSGTTLLLPQNPSPEQWGSALGDKVQWLINTKLESAELRIDPPHLGKMDISIKMTDDGTQVVIQTQHAATRELVDAAIHRLKEMLEQAGYEQVDVDVSHKESNDSDNQLAQNEDLDEQSQTEHLNNTEKTGVTHTDVIAGSFNQERRGLDLFV